MPNKRAKSKAITKPYTEEQVFKFINNYSLIQGERKELINKLGIKLLPAFKDGDKSEEMLTDISKSTDALMRVHESVHHILLLESFNANQRFGVKQMAKQIIEQYDCKTEIERTLAATIANSYTRYIDNSRRLNNELECREITKNKNVYIANLSKQIDRAHRQYLSSLMTLKQLKSPQIEMNIRAKTAFVSQNQQINSQHKNNET